MKILETPTQGTAPTTATPYRSSTWTDIHSSQVGSWKKTLTFFPKKNITHPPVFWGEGWYVVVFLEIGAFWVAVFWKPTTRFLFAKKKLAKVPDVWVLDRVVTAPHTKRQIPGEDLFWISIPPAN